MKKTLQLRKTVHLDEEVRLQLLLLWNAEYPAKLSYNSLAELDSYLQNLVNCTHYLLMSDFDQVRGWAFTFERENENWFAILLSAEVQGQGWGRKMLDRLKQTGSVLNGWVIDHNNEQKKNGQAYRSPLKFYERCGFGVLYEDRLQLDRISAVKIRWSVPPGKTV